jgi:uncharacterized membrane protein YsdA (DUF1294 family)
MDLHRQPDHQDREAALSIVALALLFAAINLWTVAAFGRDKARARAGQRRISEAELLALAAIGGSPGALLARRLFRHKTWKQPFSSYLIVIAAIQAGALIWAIAR